MSKTISTILSLQDKMSPKLVGVSAKVKDMSKEMQRASAQSANMANKLGKNMMGMADKIVKTTAKFVALGAVATAGIIFKVGIDGLKELDEASAKVKSIARAALEKKNIKVGLLKTSNATGIKTGELGDTQYNAISSGVKPNESLMAAVTSAKLGKAGFTDSNSALKVLMSTMNVYGLTGTAAMQKISDKMLIVQNLGGLRLVA
ncbi:phage tail tape measure protein [Clostridium tagluense]|uniref:phage tail tape measure protein n=1 Tax=Clostridium tagluense TaxID=360422 RepID=UPI001CF354B2|nr:phage tail tape measure protein [Clostridium tagluense]MCB2310651.1 phage tail tape measure protein [Clostridium tagluense]MCB2315618.1 phage tail tape measure protein [Clostridium tagluense]MCB2320472.1 phage tail tape measure protein [Clostridium tagluense]MCB2325245.1 phage tail tape measure protein [Clostridium tagluense]MCB2330097.1 phage tail tape measure protein [Clostridium tagluense]